MYHRIPEITLARQIEHNISWDPESAPQGPGCQQNMDWISFLKQAHTNKSNQLKFKKNVIIK